MCHVQQEKEITKQIFVESEWFLIRYLRDILPQNSYKSISLLSLTSYLHISW